MRRRQPPVPQAEMPAELRHRPTSPEHIDRWVGPDEAPPSPYWTPETRPVWAEIEAFYRQLDARTRWHEDQQPPPRLRAAG